VIGWARQQVRVRFGEQGYEMHDTVYGRDGGMGALEPVTTPAHELCIVVQNAIMRGLPAMLPVATA
jgi:hypothetical protein